MRAAPDGGASDVERAVRKARVRHCRLALRAGSGLEHRLRTPVEEVLERNRVGAVGAVDGRYRTVHQDPQSPLAGERASPRAEALRRYTSFGRAVGHRRRRLLSRSFEHVPRAAVPAEGERRRTATVRPFQEVFGRDAVAANEAGAHLLGILAAGGQARSEPAPTRPPSVSGGAKRTVTRRTARAAPAGRLFDSAWGRMRTGFWWCLDASCRLSTAKTAPLRVRVELF
jgi:hypothetical protein